MCQWSFVHWCSAFLETGNRQQLPLISWRWNCQSIYVWSPNSLPYIKSMNALYSKGLRSSIYPGVIIKLRSSPFSLQIKCNLKPKNQPIEHFPLWAMPLKTLWICILWFLQTRSGVLSTKLYIADSVSASVPYNLTEIREKSLSQWLDTSVITNRATYKQCLKGIIIQYRKQVSYELS